ncbi:DUF397 domain-containing protein [Spirillospora sp. NPDC052269]
MSANAPSRGTWRKSTHSSAQHSDCVEIAGAGLHVAVRDSKDPGGPSLLVPSAAWQAFAAEIKER